MSLRCGIVGLPNVGKSTLFNALSSAKALASNYPFCTIEPNIGVVSIPDPILDEISKIYKPQKIMHAYTEFVDIAGLVKGASQGEGLGNQFLSHIREVDAIVHLVRCFIKEDVIHVGGKVDPESDIDVINTELVLSDLQTVEKKLEKEKRSSKSGDREILKNIELLEKLKSHLDTGAPARSFKFDEKEAPYFKGLFLLTAKPILYVANQTGKEEEKMGVQKVEAFAKKENARFLTLDCALEAEISELNPEEQKEYLLGLGIKEPGLHSLIRMAFDLLGLMTYYTAGPKEVRAWTIPKATKAPQAAGVIHSDFERGFICAECFKSEDLFKYGSELKLKEAGLLRQEGKEYIVQPGDVLFFKFNV